MTVNAALVHGRALLESSSIVLPEATAEVLLAHALHCEPSDLSARDSQELSETEWSNYSRYLDERAGSKPTPYITHRQEFYGREFVVTADVLIPRRVSERVVEVALEVARDARYILDVGTGSGALGITLQLETGTDTWAADVSHAAVAVAAENARRLGATVHFAACDLTAAIGPSTMDLIVANPPYVPLFHKDSMQREVCDWEPHIAIFGGETGFELHDRLVADAPRVLRPGGWLVMEIGTGTWKHVSHLLRNWAGGRVVRDQSGNPRVIAVRRP